MLLAHLVRFLAGRDPSDVSARWATVIIGGNYGLTAIAPTRRRAWWRFRGSACVDLRAKPRNPLTLNARPPPWFRIGQPQALECLFDVLLDVAHTRLDLAEVLLDVSFHLQLFVADDLAGDFLDCALCFFNAALDLIFVHTSLRR